MAGTREVDFPLNFDGMLSMHKENAMKKLALVGAAATLLSLGLFGCNNTAEGASKDASADGQKMASATNDAVDATKIAADKATKDAAVKAADATQQAATEAADSTKKAAADTVDATKKAADATVDATKKAGADAAAAAKETGKNVTAATEVTPKVKLAIVADKDLNDTHNLINVNSSDGVVHLTGHVANASMKKKAATIASKTLKDMNATDKLSNELTIQ
jgi:predicted small secreted protein